MMDYISQDELKKHSYNHDGWVAIQGVVYDVTKFIAQHPGGSIISGYLGTDITSIFGSIHQFDGDKMLNSLKASKNRLITPVGYYPTRWHWEKNFYPTLKQRVNDYLSANQKKVHLLSRLLLLNSALLLLVFALCWWLTMIKGFYLFAFPYGFLISQVAIQIMHTANHGGFSKNRKLNKLAMYSMDLTGLSSYIWRAASHNIHHEFTNSCDDPDVTHEPVLRMQDYQQYNAHYRWQHIYYLLIYALFPIRLRWLFYTLSYLFRHPTKPRYERVVYLAFLISWIMLNVFLPITLHGISYTLLVLFCVLTTEAYFAALMFSVSHVNDFVQWNAPTDTTSWAEQQACSSANWRSGSFFWNYFSGGLNHQIEHHLFPGLNHLIYPYIQPIVYQTITEFNLPYHTAESYYELFKSNFAYLKKLGDPMKNP